MKHTYLSPESLEGQIVLKDKFTTQSAPDIRRKLQKLVFGPEQNPESLLRVATSVFFNRDEEEKREWDKRDKGQEEAFMLVLQGVSFGAPRLRKGSQRRGPGPGPAFSVAGRGI